MGDYLEFNDISSEIRGAMVSGRQHLHNEEAFKDEQYHP